MRTTTITVSVPALMLAGAIAGCLPTDPPEGVLACTSADECPEGWSCVASRCFRQPGDGGTVRDDAQVPDGGMLDAGSDDGGTDDAGTDGGMGDGGSGCSGGLVCGAAAPAGWSGPVVLVTGAGGAEAPTCPAGAPSTAFTARSGLTAPAASCACACSSPSGTLTCGSAQIRTSSSSSCIIVGSTHTTLADGACSSVTLPSSGGWYVTEPAFAASGGSACTAMPTSDVPPIEWEASYRGCGFGTPVPCGDGACVPALETGERLCVYVEGDASCPATFPDRITTAEDATDDRACSPCTCGGVTGSCSGHVDITNGCPGTILNARITIGGCTAASTNGIGSANAYYTPNGSCPPSGGAPTGTATPTGVRTVCCAAP